MFFFLFCWNALTVSPFMVTTGSVEKLLQRGEEEESIRWTEQTRQRNTQFKNWDQKLCERLFSK